jgi:DNA (cytosine-5)-methyltransferase 1
MTQPTVLDLFAGAGGMALGFHAAGAKCIGAVEYDQAAAKTFERNLGGAGDLKMFGGPVNGDVNQIPVEDLCAGLSSSPTVIVGGPPCQGFSRIGRAKQASLLGEKERITRGGVTDPGRNLLYQYFLGAVRHAMPMAFVMENVPGMREHLGNDFSKRISREAQYIGYNVRYFLLDAAQYGVPQHRWRLFFVGLRSDLGHLAVPRPPKYTHEPSAKPNGSKLPEDPWMIAGPDLPSAENLKPPVTVREAIGDLPRLTSHLNDPPKPPRDSALPLRREPSEYVQMLRDWPGFEAPDRITGNWFRFTRRDFATFREMAQGDCYPEAVQIANSLLRKSVSSMDSPPRPGSKRWNELKAQHVPPYRNDAFKDKWQKLVADKPSWTLVAHLSKDTYSHIHYDSRQARMISIREAARLQSFPDGMRFEGNYGEQFKQIGNAVPPVLARAIAEELFAQLRELGALGTD